jgi:ATP-dependent DNA helicase RecQ
VTAPAIENSAAMSAALVKLERVFGFTSLRPGQPEVVEAILAGEDVLAVMPTGAGKSLCYQLPAVVDGRLTVVVSPLIALMRDQVRQLNARGISAGALHSGNSGADHTSVERALGERSMRLLYVSPERLLKAGTLDRLRASGVERLAIDEAHCVSQWGHDFRPEYMELRAAANALGNPQIIAVTASADPGTRDEIVSKLFCREPRVFVRSFDRPNLYLAFARKENVGQQIKAFIRRHKGESGIVYCASRKGVEQLAEALSADGVWALPYHAGLDSAVRNANQDAFLKNPGVVVVATIAFGMGIDKPDVRYVCHADLPGSIEGYYQEIGRAGRDGGRAETLTLWGESDIRLRERQITLSDAPAERKAMEKVRLNALLSLCETPRCRRLTLLSAFGEKSNACGFCDICEGKHARFNGVVAAQKAMSALLRTSGRFFPGHLANLLIGKTTEAIVRHKHDALPTFGIGAEFGATEWRSIFRQIQAAGLIAQDDDESGRWHVTEEGRGVLTGTAPLELLAGETPARGRRAKGILSAIAGDHEPVRSSTSGGIAASQDGESPLNASDANLFAALKAKRMAVARQRKVPAYVVLTDRSLRDIARHRPRDESALAEIHGIGAAKIEAYGQVILELVAAHSGHA